MAQSRETPVLEFNSYTAVKVWLRDHAITSWKEFVDTKLAAKITKVIENAQSDEDLALKITHGKNYEILDLFEFLPLFAQYLYEEPETFFLDSDVALDTVKNAFEALSAESDPSLATLQKLWPEALEALHQKEVVEAKATEGIPEDIRIALTQLAEQAATAEPIQRAIKKWFDDWLAQETERESSSLTWTDAEVQRTSRYQAATTAEERQRVAKSINEELSALLQEYGAAADAALRTQLIVDFADKWEIETEGLNDLESIAAEPPTYTGALAQALETALLAQYEALQEHTVEDPHATLGHLRLRYEPPSGSVFDAAYLPLGNEAAVRRSLAEITQKYHVKRNAILEQAAPTQTDDGGGGETAEEPTVARVFRPDTFADEVLTVLRRSADVLALPTAGALRNQLGSLLAAIGAATIPLEDVVRQPESLRPQLQHLLDEQQRNAAANLDAVSQEQQSLFALLTSAEHLLEQLIATTAAPPAPSERPEETASVPTPGEEELAPTPVGTELVGPVDKWEIARLQQRLTETALFEFESALKSAGLTSAQAAKLALEHREELALELWQGLYLEATARARQGGTVNARFQAELLQRVVQERLATVVDTPAFKDAQKLTPDLKRQLQKVSGTEQENVALFADRRLSDAELQTLVAALAPAQLDQLESLVQQGAQPDQFLAILQKIPGIQPALGNENRLTFLALTLAEMSQLDGRGFFDRIAAQTDHLTPEQKRALLELQSALTLPEIGKEDSDRILLVLRAFAPDVFHPTFFAGLSAAQRLELSEQLSALLTGSLHLSGLIAHLRRVQAAQTYLLERTLATARPDGTRKHATAAQQHAIRRLFPFAFDRRTTAEREKYDRIAQEDERPINRISEEELSIRWQVAYSQAISNVTVVESREFETLILLFQAGKIDQQKMLWVLEGINADAQGSVSYETPAALAYDRRYLAALSSQTHRAALRAEAGQRSALQAQRMQRAAAYAQLAMDLMKTGGNPVALALVLLKNREAIKELVKKIAAIAAATTALLLAILAFILSNLWRLAWELMKYLWSHPAAIPAALGQLLSHAPGFVKAPIAWGLKAGLDAIQFTAPLGNVIRSAVLDTTAQAIKSPIELSPAQQQLLLEEPGNALHTLSNEVVTTTKGVGATAVTAFLAPTGLIALMTLIVITVIGGSLNDLPNGLLGLGAANNLCWPTTGTIVSLDTYRDGSPHAVSPGGHAVDIAGPIGTPIYSPYSGMARQEMSILPGFFSQYTGYGKYVRIQTDQGFELIFGHMSAYSRNGTRSLLPTSSDGFRVQAGEVIGYIGSTGNSTGPHLHYEVIGRPMADVVPSRPPLTFDALVSSEICDEVFSNTNLALQVETFTENGGGFSVSFNHAAAEYLSYGQPGNAITVETFAAQEPDMVTAINTNFFSRTPAEIFGSWSHEGAGAAFTRRDTTDEALYFLNTDAVPETILAPYSNRRNGSSPFVRYNNDGLLLLHTFLLSDAELTILHAELSPYVVDAVAGSPILIANGSPEARVNMSNYAFLSNVRARTIIGWSGSGTNLRMHFITLRAADLARAVGALQQLGLDYAVNLDGGNSTQLFVRDETLTGPGASQQFLHPEGAVRIVPALLGVRPAR